MSSEIVHSKLPLPSPGDRKSITTIDGERVYVIIGANGTGKTRLGSWLEFESPVRNGVHRISAQKSLAMPESVSPRSAAEAEASLRFGYEKGTIAHKPGHRWGSKPDTGLLNDFDKLMVFLFSEDYAKSIAYRRGAISPSGRTEPPETKLDIVQRIWESILPYRELVIGSGTISTKPTGGIETYNATEMSDGERVVFYLIAECLAAPKDGVVIIDEPELHLHKSIQALLWDAVEAERPDLTFVYLTHDLEFAASRAGAPKVCLRTFDGTNWDWYIAPADTALPEDVLLQIIGGRKPVLFVEGDDTSLDYFFLRHVYHRFTIVPAGSCEHVIHSVATFRSFKDLHRLDSFGIIDRDYREAEEIDRLAKVGVFVLSTAAIENVLLTEPVLRLAAKLLHTERTDEVLSKVRTFVFGEMASRRESIISGLVNVRIERQLRRFSANKGGIKAITDELELLTKGIDPETMWNEAERRVQDILDRNDYEGALTLFTHKGLVPQVSLFFGLKSGEYVRLIKRLVLSSEAGEAVEALAVALPVITLESAAA